MIQKYNYKDIKINVFVLLSHQTVEDLTKDLYELNIWKLSIAAQWTE